MALSQTAAHLPCFLLTLDCGIHKSRDQLLIMFEFPMNSTILLPKIDVQIN